MPNPPQSASRATRILFVDDEPNILQSLRRALHHSAARWEMRFVGTGEEALQTLAKEPFDVIAADLQMPGMDGVELLSAVQTRWPAMLRFITSGSCEPQVAVSAARVAHQFLSKPYSTAALEEAVDRALRLRHVLQDPALAQLVSGLGRVPTLPDNYARLSAALRDPSRSLQDIGALVQADAGLAARVLRVVNSAFFALPRRVTSPAEAALFLGVDVLQSLVLATDVFGGIEDRDAASVASALWEHSMEVAAATRVVGQALGCARPVVENAFLAALMHELGGLILFSDRRREYLACEARVRAGEPRASAEQQVFGATRARVAAYLLGTWGLPDAVVTSVAFHERPAESEQRGVDSLALLHLAHGLSAQAGTLDAPYLDACGLLPRIAELAAAVRESRNPAKAAPDA